MNFLQTVAKFLGWLTGVLAGITAILYACGYLITQTQFHLLGIHVLLPSNRDYYLHEGANFFIVTGQKAGLLALGLVFLALAVCIPWSILKKSGKGVQFNTAFQRRFGSIPPENRWRWNALALLIMILLLFFPLLRNLDIFRAPLELAGLLANLHDAAYPATLGEEARQVFASLNGADTRHLNDLYYLLLMHCLLAGFLLWAVRKLTTAWPLKFVLTFPFVMIFAIYVFLLPQDFVVFQKRFTFPAVAVLATVDEASDLSEELLLLNKTDREFILFNPTTQKTLWVPIAKVAKIEIGPARPVFGRRPPIAKEKPEP